MRSLYTAAIIVGVTVLGVTAGMAYAAKPDVSQGIKTTERTAAPVSREVLGPQVGGTAIRKFARAFCAAGEGVTGGGFNIQGGLGTNGKYGFNTWGSPAPKAIPVVTEARVVHREGSGVTGWQVYATAPSNLTGKWWLQAIAICA